MSDEFNDAVVAPHLTSAVPGTLRAGLAGDAVRAARALRGRSVRAFVASGCNSAVRLHAADR
jgi:hypothetical protein